MHFVHLFSHVFLSLFWMQQTTVQQRCFLGHHWLCSELCEWIIHIRRTLFAIRRQLVVQQLQIAQTCISWSAQINFQITQQNLLAAMLKQLLQKHTHAVLAIQVCMIECDDADWRGAVHTFLSFMAIFKVFLGEPLVPKGLNSLWKLSQIDRLSKV